MSTISVNPATGSWGAPSRATESESEYCSFEIINDALCVASGTGENRRVAIVAYPAGNTKENFDLSENLIDVNGYAFDETVLKSITLKSTAPSTKNENKISIYGYAFNSNPQLEKLSIEAEGDVQLNSGMANGCANLERIDIGSGVTNYSVIDDVIYQKVNDELTLISYPGGKKDNVFNIPDGVKRISASAMSQNGFVSEVIMPQGLTHIDSEAFYKCLQLSKVYFPSTLQAISYNAFWNCPLENIILPASLTQLDDDAFYSTQNTIKNVTVLCDTPPLSSNGEVAGNIFSPETLENATLTIPDNVDCSTFTSHPAWAFKNVRSAGIEDVNPDADSDFYIDGKTVISKCNNVIELFHIDGTIVGTGKKVTVPSPGIYIVRQGSKASKISLR